MLYSAGPVAKAVVIILFIFSIISWTIMLVKLSQYRRTERDGERFLKTVREADSFKKLISLNRENADNSFYRQGRRKIWI
jgi:biopolymer transport protein TolQ